MSLITDTILNGEQSTEKCPGDANLETKSDPILLQDLPIGIIEEIVSYFNYGFCLSLRTLSLSFHYAVTRKFRVGYKRLFTRIRKKVQHVEFSIKQLSNCMSKSADGERIMCLMMPHAIMRILESEAAILKAICHRYIENGKWNFLSTYSARLLEEFHFIISLLFLDHSDTDIDPKLISQLLFLCGQFIEHFMSYVEPSLDLTVPFEVKLADILDSLKDSTVSYKLFEWDLGYRLNSFYQLKNMTSLEFPWVVFEDVSIEEKLSSILMTMKNNVRLSNYCFPLREVWLMENILKVNGIDGLKEHLNEPKHFHVKRNQEVPCKRVHPQLEWRSGELGWSLMSDEVHKQKPYLIDVHSLEAQFQIEGGPKPLKLLTTNEELIKQDSNSLDKGVCDIRLFVQHASQCDIRLHRSCIRIVGKNGTYSIKFHDYYYN